MKKYQTQYVQKRLKIYPNVFNWKKQGFDIFIP